MTIITIRVFVTFAVDASDVGCPSGRYGDDCELKCSPNCLPLPNGHIYCDKQNAECVDGCKRGFMANNVTKSVM